MLVGGQVPFSCSLIFAGQHSTANIFQSINSSCGVNLRYCQYQAINFGYDAYRSLRAACSGTETNILLRLPYIRC